MRIALLGARFPLAAHPPHAGWSRASVPCEAA